MMIAANPILQWGGLTFNCHSYEVSWHEKDIDLTPTELYVIKYFMTNPASLVTVMELIENVRDRDQRLVWPADKVLPTEFTIRTHVNNLRNRFKAAGAPDPIERKRGMGYRLSRRLKS